jgi:hypothetical protein
MNKFAEIYGPRGFKVLTTALMKLQVLYLV